MIRIDHINVRLPGFSLQDVAFTVEKGEFFALLGPTGSGKTLLLESIAGLMPVTSGMIEIHGKDITRLPPERRGISLVYQDDALFPHLTVYENITYGLRYTKKPASDLTEQVNALIRHLRLERLLARSIHHLSGGEKQRVALARALAVSPDVLLLDEPLSSLDPNFREEIRKILKQLHLELGVTVMMVTHDFSDAYYLAQRTAVIHSGRVEQIGDVAEVFRYPATPFVAEFVGMKNIFPAVLENGHAHIGELKLKIKNGKNADRCIAIRPEKIHISPQISYKTSRNCLVGMISKIIDREFHVDIVVDVLGISFQTVMMRSARFEQDLYDGQKVMLTVAPEDIHVIPMPVQA